MSYATLILILVCILYICSSYLILSCQLSYVAVYRKFEKAMDVLQGDIDALEQEKTQLTKKLDHQSKKAIAGIMGSRYTASKNFFTYFFNCNNQCSHLSVCKCPGRLFF